MVNWVVLRWTRFNPSKVKIVMIIQDSLIGTLGLKLCKSGRLSRNYQKVDVSHGS